MVHGKQVQKLLLGNSSHLLDEGVLGELVE